MEQPLSGLKVCIPCRMSSSLPVTDQFSVPLTLISEGPDGATSKRPEGVYPVPCEQFPAGN
jgi:hypothetical protein